MKRLVFPASPLHDALVKQTWSGFDMSTYTIYSAKTHLSRLIEQACSGEEVVIARGKKALVKLVPIEAKPRGRVFGAMKGKAAVTDAFFEPLPDEELDARIKSNKAQSCSENP
jgi:antitoxin (DNA-binding transcriptional repressor) of toxin-antitoxin stability system